MHDHDKFRQDMATAGYEVEEYGGRWYWEGPAVFCAIGEEDGVVRATSVKLQRDSMGKGVVLYPRAYAESRGGDHE